MQTSREVKKLHKLQATRTCKTALCCSNCSRLSSVSSSSDNTESFSSDRYPPTISSLTHAIVQQKLDQMIRERQKKVIRNEENKVSEQLRPRVKGDHGSKFIVMVAMEKTSYDPRKNFRESIEEMINGYQIHQVKDLRCLLNYYISMNSDEHRVIILEIFHEVCTNLFLSSSKYYRFRK